MADVFDAALRRQDVHDAALRLQLVRARLCDEWPPAGSVMPTCSSSPTRPT